MAIVSRKMKTLLAAAAVTSLALALGLMAAWRASSLEARLFGSPAEGNRTDRSAIPVALAIGEARLSLDPAFLRNPDQRKGGRFERLDVALLMPDFKPAGALDARDLARPDRDADMLFVTIVPQDGTLDPADRPTQLYARFLEPGAPAPEIGLIHRRFAEGSPYENEDLYMAPPEGRLFAARCRGGQGPLFGPGSACLHEFRTHGLDVLLRFAPARLADWDRLADRVHALIAQALH
jgi:hypothetical protein